jgi:hypothetical protein
MCHIRAIHLLPRKNKGNVPWTIINAMIFVTEKQSISFLCSVNRAPLCSLANKANLVHIFFVCLFLFSIRFGRMCVHHQEKQLYLCTPHNSHPQRITSTKCRIITVVSPDDGHIVARNMLRKEINTLRKTVHRVGFIHKIYKRCLLGEKIWFLE